LLADRFQDTEQHCRLRRLSSVIDELGVPTIDLLKIDVQRAELDVLRGLDDRHWPLIQQIAMEVHDAPGTATEGRVDDVADLLDSHSFQVTAEQDGSLAGTDRFTVYAVRPGYADDVRTVVSSSASGTVDDQTLRDWLIARIPSQLVPDVIVTLDEIPLTANGKVDRAALPAPTSGLSSADRVPPENAVEEALVEIWQDVLGLDQVGVTKARDGELQLTLTYADATVMPEQVVSLGERYRRLLSLLCNDGDAPVPMLGDTEHGQKDAWTDRLAGMWREVLGVAPWSATTDFFQAGGSSLLALRFVAALRLQHGVSLDLAEFTRQARFDTLVDRCASADARG
jgi:hypothetical protein